MGCETAREANGHLRHIPAGILAAVKRNSILDHGVMGVSLTGYSMPIFWWGLLLILLFSVQLDLTPVSGRIGVEYFFEPVTGFLLIDSLLSGQEGAFASAAMHLVLPTIVLGTNPGGLREVILNPVPRPRAFSQFHAPEFLAVKSRLEGLIHPPVEHRDDDLLPLARMTEAGDDVE